MNSEQRELWSTIRSFDIDGGPASLTFSKRLARENGWSHGFSERVIDEYRKFVFLCMASGHKCTPSDEVDQAWHLHMIYTESYWTRFCGEVLPRPLHHGPTKGGQAEDDKFVDWYERTKESYRAFFGQEPPLDIWPSSQHRFANASAWKRVDTSQFWMIPRRSLSRASAWSAGALALMVGGVGCNYLAQASSGITAALFIFVLFLVLVIFIAIAAANNNRGGSGNGSHSHYGSGCGSSGCGSSSSKHGNDNDGGSSDSSSGCGSSGCGSSGCGGGGCGGGGCGS